jgi:hypothetical protein
MANATVTVTEAGAGTDLVVLDVGRQAAAASKSLATCTEDKAVLDAIAASLSVMDDWDSSDTAKVTPQAGELHLGEVGGKSALRIVTMTPDTSALASGDLIADTQQVDAFFRKADGTGVINTITITEKDAQGAAYYIIFHRTSTSMGTENSAPNISDANLVAGIQHIVAVATSDFVTVSGTKIATLRNLGLPVMAVSGTDDIYISILNSTGTPTYASGEIQLGIGVMLD